MKKRQPDAMYFTDIARAGKDKVLLVGHRYSDDESDAQVTVCLTLNKGVWGGTGLTGIAHAVRLEGGATDPKRVYLVLERNSGLYRLPFSGQDEFVKISTSRPGFLMDLRLIGEHWYAVGGHHRIHREENGRWKSFDKGVYVAGEAGNTKVLLSIAGIAEDDIYAVGYDGVILHYNGKKWLQCRSPTEVGLQRVLCVSEDEVYVCGNSRTLYRGNRNGWTPVTETGGEEAFWDMVHFKRKVYVCTKKKLFTIEKDGLKEVAIDVEGPLGFYRLTADDNELWSCGNECVLRFDGKTWKQYIYPANVCE